LELEQKGVYESPYNKIIALLLLKNIFSIQNFDEIIF